MPIVVQHRPDPYAMAKGAYVSAGQLSAQQARLQQAEQARADRRLAAQLQAQAVGRQQQLQAQREANMTRLAQQQMQGRDRERLMGMEQQGRLGYLSAQQEGQREILAEQQEGLAQRDALQDALEMASEMAAEMDQAAAENRLTGGALNKWHDLNAELYAIRSADISPDKKLPLLNQWGANFDTQGIGRSVQPKPSLKWPGDDQEYQMGQVREGPDGTFQVGTRDGNMEWKQLVGRKETQEYLAEQDRLKIEAEKIKADTAKAAREADELKERRISRRENRKIAEQAQSEGEDKYKTPEAIDAAAERFVAFEYGEPVPGAADQVDVPDLDNIKPGEVMSGPAGSGIRYIRDEAGRFFVLAPDGKEWLEATREELAQLLGG